MIEVRDLRRRFRDVLAVDGVSFRAEDARITGLLGPNGAGKTTTLRALYGILRPDGGQAYIDGLDVQKDPISAQRRLGVLPDARGLYARLTSREHLRYVGGLYGLGGEPLDERIRELAGALDMKTILDRRVAGFSAGERMKVALGRALIHNPQNVVLDEPTTGLDVLATRALRRIVGQLRDEGRCVIFSSHIMQEVSALCDEVVVMARGQVAAQGSPSLLCAQAGEESLEDAFVAIIGTAEGLG